jgi:hypothetical protein
MTKLMFIAGTVNKGRPIQGREGVRARVTETMMPRDRSDNSKGVWCDGISPYTVGLSGPLYGGYQDNILEDNILEDNILAYAGCLDQL